MPIAPSICPRHCIGLISRPISARVHRMQDAHLGGDAMHREPHAMHVERDGAWREIGLALGLEPMPLGRTRRVQLRQRNAAVAAQHRVRFQPALGALRAGVAAGIIKNILAQRRRRQRHRLPRDHGAGAGEGAGVVRRAVGVGVDDVDLPGATAQQLGGDLAVRGDGAVAHLGGTHREVVAPVRREPHLRTRAMLGWRPAFQHR